VLVMPEQELDRSQIARSLEHFPIWQNELHHVTRRKMPKRG
jgi:hypothetical protein